MDTEGNGNQDLPPSSERRDLRLEHNPFGRRIDRHSTQGNTFRPQHSLQQSEVGQALGNLERNRQQSDTEGYLGAIGRLFGQGFRVPDPGALPRQNYEHHGHHRDHEHHGHHRDHEHHGHHRDQEHHGHHRDNKHHGHHRDNKHTSDRKKRTHTLHENYDDFLAKCHRES
jgi:hypothetical protein